MSSSPCRYVGEVEPPDFARLRSRAVLEGCKWDPQYEDVTVLSPVPLVLEPTVWEELATAAEALADEALAAEQELLARRDLHRRLGLPRAVRTALSRARTQGSHSGRARVMRVDFHWTTAGWSISEANTDVPGGYVEAATFTELVALHFPGTRPCGDPAGALANAAARAATAPVVALVHATSYADDRQVMDLLGLRLRALGLDPQPVAPDHLAWKGERACLDTAWSHAEVGAILRFFPAEWLPQLPRASGWQHYYVETPAPQSNPGTALLTQSKRWPLVWSELDTPVPAWRRLLPETRDPREVSWRDGCWVLKPALGRVGEDVGVPGVTSARQWRAIGRAARWRPGDWVAQRRFEVVPLTTPAGDVYPCFGVFVVDGRAAGAYGRLASQPLVDARAREAAVLLAAEGAAA